jgi:hypothetical protein
VKITPKRPLAVNKDLREAVIYLEGHRIVGTIHLPPNGRLSDFINFKVTDGPFIPLTGVQVFAEGAETPLFSTDFLAVHRNHIRFLTVEQTAAPEPPPPRPRGARA